LTVALATLCPTIPLTTLNTMFKIQILLNNTWRDLTYPNPRQWDQAVELFTFYMNTWTDNDYRIVSV